MAVICYYDLLTSTYLFLLPYDDNFHEYFLALSKTIKTNESLLRDSTFVNFDAFLF